MKKYDIIKTTVKLIRYNAYTARICDELQGLQFDENMMKYHRDIASGKAFGGLELLNHFTGKGQDDIYNEAVEEATQDIIKTDYNIVKLLDLAGFDGEAYYKTVTG